MNTQRSLYLIGGEDDEQALFLLHGDNDICRLSCSYRGKLIEAEAADFFDALCKIRRQLWDDGLIPFCYGASMNVYPSGMARDMGKGLKAYKLTEGQHTSIVDLVDIFAEGPDVVPAPVEIQQRFWEDWLASVRESAS
ncbi:hypothetical protein [Dongia deserti]|uniref:hypothetical protein n=1 Tax=Dongia deserti TaxID=2268030 RepID=UPI000E654CD7|nr:hypothetical protein [Dongia deserti]